MSNLQTLIAQREELEKKINELRQQEHVEAVTKVRTLVTEFGLTKDDVFPTTRTANKTKKPLVTIAPKYRDPDSGKSWSGRGLTPTWLAGKDKADFLIPNNAKTA